VHFVNNLTPYRTAAHSLRQFVLTTQSNTLPHNCPTHFVNLYSQPNLTPYHIAVPLTPSVFFGVQ